MPLVGGFGCLELCLYGKRRAGPIRAQYLDGSGPMRGLHYAWGGAAQTWQVQEKLYLAARCLCLSALERRGEGR